MISNLKLSLAQKNDFLRLILARNEQKQKSYRPFGLFSSI